MDQDSFNWDICSNRHGGNEYSDEAHDSIVSGKAAMWSAILRYLYDSPDTCDGYEAFSGARHQTASARFAELKAAGKIAKVGEKLTRSGCKAAIYAIALPAEE